MPRTPLFQVQNRNIFLTYPQCSLTKEEALSQLRALFPTTTRAPSYIRVASELHLDGQPHLHCLLQFPYRFETQHKRFFDLVSPNRSTHFHPNIQGARNASAVQEYISKYGEFVDDGAYYKAGGRKSFQERYADAINTGSRERALEFIKANHSRSFVFDYRNINYNLDKIFQKPRDPYVPSLPPCDAVPNEIQEWARDNIKDEAHRPHMPKSLILEGRTRVGKTCWARSLGPHNYYNFGIDLRDYDDGAYYNVIDNVLPASLKRWKEFIGAERDWVANLKAKKPRRIKGGIPTIILCNPGAEWSYKDFLEKPKNASLKTWTIANADFQFIQAPLFSSSNQTQTRATEKEEIA